jgi:hypothetical protein
VWEVTSNYIINSVKSIATQTTTEKH